VFFLSPSLPLSTSLSVVLALSLSLPALSLTLSLTLCPVFLNTPDSRFSFLSFPSFYLPFLGGTSVVCGIKAVSWSIPAKSRMLHPFKAQSVRSTDHQYLLRLQENERSELEEGVK
jgi:hypothetical protein